MLISCGKQKMFGKRMQPARLTTSDEKHIVSHGLTQLRLARSHARTTRTRNETEANFPVGFSRSFFPPNLRYMIPARDPRQGFFLNQFEE